MYTTIMFAIGLIGFSQLIATQEILKKTLIAIFTFLIIFVLQKMKGQQAIRLKKEKEKQKNELERLETIENRIKQFQVAFVCSPFSAKAIGGFGYDLKRDQNLNVGITDSALILVKKDDHPESTQIYFDDINEFEISGPGKITSNAGFIGGGFGLEGFLQGAVAAAVINAATTKTSTNTFVRVLSNRGEIYLHTTDVEPESLKIQLSPLLVNLANRAKNFNSNNVADELERLQALLKSGILSQLEFEVAKKKVLS